MHLDNGNPLEEKRRKLAKFMSERKIDPSPACLTADEKLGELERRLIEQEEQTRRTPVIKFPDGKDLKHANLLTQSKRPLLEVEDLKDPVRVEKYKCKQKKDVLKREIKELESALGKINLSIDAHTHDGGEAQLKNLEDSKNRIMTALAQKRKELAELEQLCGSDDWYVC